MLMLSLAAMVEEAALNGETKRLSGNVADLDVLLREDSLRVFEREHGGVFAFLAFHPVADNAVADYITEGTLAFDSGPTILVLFTSSTYADTPQVVTRSTLGGGLTIEAAALPAQHMMRALFSTKAVPPLPGLLVFDSFTEPGEALRLAPIVMSYFAGDFEFASPTGNSDADRVEQGFQRILTETDKGNFSESIRISEELLTDHPWSALLRHELAIALDGAGRLDEALKVIVDAVTLRPTDPDLWQSLAVILRRCGAADEQLRALAVQRSLVSRAG